MLEQDAVHIGCEADLAAHVLDEHGRQLSVKGLFDTGAVVGVMPVSTWIDMGFDRSDLIPSNVRLAPANQGATYVTGPNHITAAWRKTSLDELPGSGKFGRIRSIHPGKGLRTQF